MIGILGLIAFIGIFLAIGFYLGRFLAGKGAASLNVSVGLNVLKKEEVEGLPELSKEDEVTYEASYGREENVQGQDRGQDGWPVILENSGDDLDVDEVAVSFPRGKRIDSNEAETISESSEDDCIQNEFDSAEATPPATTPSMTASS